MQLYKSTDYATMLLVFLSDHATSVVSSAQIAEQLRLRHPMVMKLLKQLTRAGLLTATRGQAGGYRLARSIEAMTLADVMIAVSEELAMTACAKQHVDCQLVSHCPLRANWLVVNQVILTVLQRIRLCDMKQPLVLSELHPLMGVSQ